MNAFYYFSSTESSKNQFSKYYIFSWGIAVIVGTLLHFAFDISNNCSFVGLFTPVNESVWEHLKLVALPITIFAILHFVIQKQDKFLSAGIAIIISSCFIIYIHYFFEMINVSTILVDILCYILAMLIAFYYISKSNFNTSKAIGITLLVLIILTLGVFTIKPPKTPLFLDKTTNTYGIT